MPFTITATRLVSESGSVGKDGRSYELVYHVDFSGGWDCRALATNSDPALPHYYDDHHADSAAYCSQIKCDLHPNDGGEDEGIAVYTCSFSPKKFNSNPDPVARDPDIEWQGSDTKEATDVDADGNAIINSAGDLYVPKQEQYIRASECTVTIFQTDNPAADITNYSWTTNNATWNGVAAGNGLIRKIRATRVSEVVAGVLTVYWAVTYPLAFRPDGWRKKYVDNGFRKVTAGVRRGVFDELGQQPQVPILLDGAGGELAVGGTPVIYPATGYKQFATSDWSALGIPNIFV